MQKPALSPQVRPLAGRRYRPSNGSVSPSNVPGSLMQQQHHYASNFPALPVADSSDTQKTGSGYNGDGAYHRPQHRCPGASGTPPCCSTPGQPKSWREYPQEGHEASAPSGTNFLSYGHCSVESSSAQCIPRMTLEAASSCNSSELNQAPPKVDPPLSSQLASCEAATAPFVTPFYPYYSQNHGHSAAVAPASGSPTLPRPSSLSRFTLQHQLQQLQQKNGQYAQNQSFQPPLTSHVQVQQHPLQTGELASRSPRLWVPSCSPTDRTTAPSSSLADYSGTTCSASGSVSSPYAYSMSVNSVTFGGGRGSAFPSFQESAAKRSAPKEWSLSPEGGAPDQTVWQRKPDNSVWTGGVTASASIDNHQDSLPGQRGNLCDSTSGGMPYAAALSAATTVASTRDAPKVSQCGDLAAHSPSVLVPITSVSSSHDSPGGGGEACSAKTDAKPSRRRSTSSLNPDASGSPEDDVQQDNVPIRVRAIVSGWKAGTIIGRQGAAISSLRQAFRCKITVSSDPTSADRVLTVVGPWVQVAGVVRKVCSVLAAGSKRDASGVRSTQAPLFSKDAKETSTGFRDDEEYCQTSVLPRGASDADDAGRDKHYEPSNASPRGNSSSSIPCGSDVPEIQSTLLELRGGVCSTKEKTSGDDLPKNGGSSVMEDSVSSASLSFTLAVPSSLCGCLIGRGGSQIRNFRQGYGVSFSVSSTSAPLSDSQDRLVSISGPACSVADCLAEVCRLFSMAARASFVPSAASRTRRRVSPGDHAEVSEQLDQPHQQELVLTSAGRQRTNAWHGSTLHGNTECCSRDSDVEISHSTEVVLQRKDVGEKEMDQKPGMSDVALHNPCDNTAAMSKKQQQHKKPEPFAAVLPSTVSAHSAEPADASKPSTKRVANRQTSGPNARRGGAGAPPSVSTAGHQEPRSSPGGGPRGRRGGGDQHPAPPTYHHHHHHSAGGGGNEILSSAIEECSFTLSTGEVEVHLLVPNDIVGCIIGRKGKTISEIRDTSGTFISITESSFPPAAPHNAASTDAYPSRSGTQRSAGQARGARQRDRVICIRGPSKNVRTARFLMGSSILSAQKHGGSFGTRVLMPAVSAATNSSSLPAQQAPCSALSLSGRS